MKKLVSDNGNEYTLLTPFETAGNCQFAQAEFNGNKYFVKTFLSPKFPKSGSEETKRKKLEACKIFYEQQQSIMEKFRTITSDSGGGNLIVPIDFFHDNSQFYKISELVNIETLNITDISNFTWKEKSLILKTIISSVGILHRLNIVHGDLKPDNILISISETKKFVAKVIDMDSSYFAYQSPDKDTLVFTPPYASPEIGKYIKSDDDEDRKKISCKSDIYALGIIFSQYVSGIMPTPKDATYKECWVATLNSGEIECNLNGSPRAFQQLIKNMLHVDPNLRPSAFEILNILKDIEKVDTKSAVGDILVDVTSSIVGKIKSTFKRDYSEDVSSRTVDNPIKIINNFKKDIGKDESIPVSESKDKPIKIINKFKKK